MYRLFRSNEYTETFSRLDNAEQTYVLTLEEGLKEIPFGKPLGFKFLREKRIGGGGKRVIFLVYDEIKTVFCIAITDKKDQKKIIRIIKGNLKLYRAALHTLLEKTKLLSLFLQGYLATLSKDFLYRLYLKMLIL